MHDETIQAASGARAHPDNAHQYTILSSSLYSRSPPNARFDLDEFFARDQTDAHGAMYDEIRLHHSTRARVSTPHRRPRRTALSVSLHALLPAQRTIRSR